MSGDTNEIKVDVYIKICSALKVSTDAAIEFVIDRMLENSDIEGSRYTKAFKILEDNRNINKLVMQYHKDDELNEEECFQELNKEELRDNNYKQFIKEYLKKYGYSLFEDYIEKLTVSIIDKLIFDSDDDSRKYQRLYALLTSDKSGRYESRLEQEIRNAVADLKISGNQINLKKVPNMEYFSKIISKNDSEEVQKSKLKEVIREAYDTFDFSGESKSIAYRIMVISFGVCEDEEIEGTIDSILNIFDIEYTDECRYEAVVNYVRRLCTEGNTEIENELNGLDDDHIPPSIRKFQESLNK